MPSVALKVSIASIAWIEMAALFVLLAATR
jgi:hypothetical protein